MLIIEKQLMNNQTDPFSMDKLTIDMVEPCVELKQMIEN